MINPAAAPKSVLRLFDPRLTGGLRDEYMGQVRCMAARPPRHHRSQLLTARAAGRIFCGGDGAGGNDGRINAWSTSNGALLCAQSLDANVLCMCVVETVRPGQPLRAPGPAGRPGAADGFGCELIVWAGLANGQVAVLAGGDLALRVVLGGHQGAITCICSPGAPPSSPAVGAAVVLSGGADGAMRMWDARTAECLRQIPGGGAGLQAMLPVWLPDGDQRRERCKIWSADADQTLCVWEPRRPLPTHRGGDPAPPLPSRGGPKAVAEKAAADRQLAQAPPPQTVTLNADVSALCVSTDGTLVCATAGKDGVLVLDGNARLRSRLSCSAAAGASEANSEANSASRHALLTPPPPLPFPAPPPPGGEVRTNSGPCQHLATPC